MRRIRAAFWAHARGRVNYTTYGLYELALQAEKKRHIQLKDKGLSLSGERFDLDNYESDDFDSLEAEIKEQDKVNVESGVAERAWNKCTYREREVRQWLDCGILTFDEIVNHLMSGVVKMI